MALKKARLSSDAGGTAIQGALHPTTTTVIAFTDSSGANSSAILAEVVRLIAAQDCYVKFGTGADVAATTSDMLLKAGQPEYFTMDGNSYIAAIRATSNSGNLYATIMI
jgi:hypothetical protein